MNCNEFIDNISSYIDNDMNEVEKKEFELHILECNKCRQEYEDMIKILEIVKSQDQVELPDNYRLELKRKLKEAAKEEKRINWGVLSSIAAGLIIMIISFSMFYNKLPFMGQKQYLSKSNEIESPKESMGFDASEHIASVDDEEIEMKSAYTDSSINSSIDETNIAINSVPEEEDAQADAASLMGFGTMASRSSIGKSRKTIKEAFLSIELEELDIVQEQITKYVEKNGGFVENIDNDVFGDDYDTNVKQRSNLIKIRIPSEEFDKTLEFLGQLGTLVDENSTLDDITEEYYNIESNLRCLYEQENLLLGILYKVEDEEDKALVEEELKKIKEEINSEASALVEYDNSVMLSTINTQLNEVGEGDW